MENCNMYFSDFTSLLIQEMLNGIIDSKIEQEKVILHMQKELDQDLNYFQKKYINYNDIRFFLQEIFPTTTKCNNSTIVDPKQPYIPKTNKQDETPPIFKTIGYSMKSNIDYIQNKNEDNYIISDTGYQKIHNLASEILAQDQKNILKNLISKGIPRVHIDYGNISSKFILSFSNKNNNSKKDRLCIKTVDINSPTYLTLQQNIISEININFKTIIP
ncbi:hypothetical protein COL35_29180 [Bacillus toyonensis]|uniref:hypothetical protein n=1 Tax=Bacillus toyonensis TaxID=155322 RepID=UPI000BF39E6C|nr:hypothetical protein [Bacillus toyonensis]PFX63064.1 hypothetical protein COL35_29180 [Bacillus toyonensis]